MWTLNRLSSERPRRFIPRLFTDRGAGYRSVTQTKQPPGLPARFTRESQSRFTQTTKCSRQIVETNGGQELGQKSRRPSDWILVGVTSRNATLPGFSYDHPYRRPRPRPRAHPGGPRARSAPSANLHQLSVGHRFSLWPACGNRWRSAVGPVIRSAASRCLGMRWRTAFDGARERG